MFRTRLPFRVHQAHLEAVPYETFEGFEVEIPRTAIVRRNIYVRRIEELGKFERKMIDGQMAAVMRFASDILKLFKYPVCEAFAPVLEMAFGGTHGEPPDFEVSGTEFLCGLCVPYLEGNPSVVYDRADNEGGITYAGNQADDEDKEIYGVHVGQ